MDQAAKFAREIILADARALNVLSDKVDLRFGEAISLLEDVPPRARVVCTGVGKAGFIAAKTAATLSSIGIAAFSLDPADALHGDLGSLIQGDVILVFSSSGETAEIVKLVPLCRQIGCPVIGVTCNDRSYLAKESDAFLSLGSVSEAGPLGLAPTTSTTLMLSMSNAICMTLLSRRNFSREDFAKFHPAGSLGRKLKKVSEVMRSDSRLCLVSESDTVRKVLQSISNTVDRPGAAVIVDENGLLKGIFTDGDLRRCLTADENFLENPVSHYMGTTPKKIYRTASCEEALNLLTELKIDQIVVVDESEKACGLLDIQDVARL